MFNRKTSSFFFLLFFTAVFTQAQSLSGTYTLDPKGGGDFKTFKDLETSLRTNGVSGPVKVDVKSGTYNEQVSFTSIPGISSKSPVVIKGDGPTSTLMTFNTTSSAGRYVVRIQNLNNFTFRDIGVKSTGTSYGWGIHVLSSGTQVEAVNIINCVSEVRVQQSTNFIPILFNGSTTSWSSSNRPIRNCKIDSCKTIGGYAGILFASVRNSSTGVGNQILNTEVKDYSYYGLYLNSLYGFEVDNCDITSGSSTSLYGTAIQLFNNSSGGTRVVKINNNRIYHNGRNGIYMSSAPGGSSTTNPAQRGQIFNNMIVMTGNTTNIRGMYINYSAYYDMWHNSISVKANVSDKTNSCIYIGLQANYCSIVNNNLANMATSGSAVPLYIPVAPLGLRIDYNNYYNAASSRILQIINSFGPTSFKGGGGHNEHSFNLDPSFVASNDLHLKSDVAFPFGDLTTGINLDIDGDKRCSFASSIGADQSEFVPTGKPKFKALDSAFVQSPATFLNQAAALDPLQYTWSVDGKDQAKSFNFTYSFPATGTYTVTLKSTTCSGTSTDSTITIKVVAQTIKPTADFALSESVIETNDAVDIKDLSSNGPTQWDYTISPSTFYNVFTQQTEETYAYVKGDESKPTGQILFFAPGKYEICLETGNKLGTDKKCKKDILEVLYADQMCSFFTGSSEAKGVLYDDGGRNAYNLSKNCSYLIEPCGGELVLDFDVLELADGDFLRIYDGVDNDGTPLWDVNNYSSGWTGDLTGIHLSLVAKSGKAFVEFETDNSTATIGSGFKLEWSVDPKTFTAPKAAFTATDTVCVESIASFKNESSGSFNHYEWWIDGELESKESDLLEQTFLFAGSYEVKLKAINCGGVDSVSRTVVVGKQSKTAKANFGADNLTPNVGERIQLWNMTTYCFENSSWTISPSTYSFEGGSTSKSSNPYVSFSKAGCYSVTLEVTNTLGTTKKTETCFINVGKYCVPSTQVLSSDLGIVQFNMDNINQSSDADSKGYTSYASSTSATFTQGASYPFELVRGGDVNNFTGSIWIDLDGDGTFSNTELLLSASNVAGKVWKDTIKIPITGSNVVARMRIQTTSAFGTPRVCGPNPVGEYEDYRVEIVTDNDIPEITLKGTSIVSISEGYGFVDPGFTANDKQSGDITNDVVVSGAVNTKLAGTYNIDYDVEDEAGNKAVTVSRTVTVTQDTTRPGLTLIGNARDTIYVGDVYVDAGAESEDLLDGTLTTGIKVTNPLDVDKIGTYIIVYESEDSRNNVGTIRRYVTVLDSTKPAMSLVGADTVKHEVLVAYTDLGTDVLDNHDDATTIKVEVSTTLNIEKPGIYPYTICATDQSGNTSCVTRYVDVADRTNPLIALRGDVSINHEVNTTFIDPWVTTSDNFTRTVIVTTGGDYDGTADELGTFTIWYYAEDEAGNKDSVSRELVVADTEGPSITLNGNDIEQIERWTDFVDPGVSAQDNFDDAAALVITVDGDFENTQSVGRYFITYQAEDLSGNKSVILTRIVDVVQSSTNIEDQDVFAINLYPNPSTTQFTIQAKFDQSEDLLIQVRDLAGRLVYDQSLPNATTLNQTISTANWKSGSYLVYLSTGSKRTVERLSVVR